MAVLMCLVNFYRKLKTTTAAIQHQSEFESRFAGCMQQIPLGVGPLKSS